MELLGDGGAANDAPLFDDPHLQAGRGEVAGAGQAVVAGANDDDIQPFGRHGSYLKQPARAPGGHVDTTRVAAMR